MEEHKIIAQFPSAPKCFACQEGIVEGIGLTAYRTEDDYAVSKLMTKPCHQGFEGIIHGGVIATYFDEMAHFAILTKYPDAKVMTIEHNVRYHKPIPVDHSIRIVSKAVKNEGRLYQVESRIYLENNEIAASASTKYLAVRKENVVHGTSHSNSDYYHNTGNLDTIAFDW